MRKVGLDKSLLDNVSQSFCDFCGASIPSEFLFLKFYIEFLKSAQMPREFVSHVGAMTDVTSLQDKFISSKGLNEVSAMPSGDTLQPFPSDLLDMIDRKWPYQTYAPARQPGQHTTLTLLECETCTKVAALYVASLQWYPRPLGTQKPLDYTFNPAPESASRNSSAQSPTPSTKRSSTTSEQPLSTTLVPSSSTRIPPAITEGPPPFQQTTSLSASCKRIGGAVVCPTTNESSTGAGD
ncbi:hypothetical protein CC78DRAFT_528560 [Lojkania enalia]|uniref:Uncharacterized protein n=1 Tax=Lojkania enalia TaxID=147567 RepID=A0A9P4NBD9_9PLEO|nr:hypothetical protein CC78DRAFT_528560 [Didymosphaeria enalia]